jgi:alkylation response protein AidB-like acyl-CoA dehydrogenase
MPASDYQIDLRDIRFNLFEHLPFDKLHALPAFAEADRDSIELLLEECYKFNREVIAPLNKSGDRQGCSCADGKVTLPDGFAAAGRAFAENGWLTVATGSEHGGMGLPIVVGVATGEMNVGACCSLSISTGLTRAAARLIADHAAEELRALYVPKLLSGSWQGTMCLTEPQAGSALGDIKAIAKRDGDAWYLSGTKCFISAGEHDMCENHVHLVLARTPGAPRGFKGISLFLVPKRRPTAEGEAGEPNDVACAGIEHKMGLKGSPTCTMSFGDEGRCRAWLIGAEGGGLPIMFHMMNEARIGVGLQGLGLAAQAYAYARDYARERVQGVDILQMKNLDAPRVTIDQHPDVRRMLLHAKAIVEGSRALIYTAAFHADLAAGSDDKEQAARSFALLEILTPICKAYVSDRGFDVTRLAMQVMGGYGYISEYPVEQHMRDVKVASIYEGTNGIQALDLLGRKLQQQQGLLLRTLLGELESFTAAQRGHLTLGEEARVLEAEVARWRQTTMDLGARGMEGDRIYPVLCATPYLEMAGNVVLGWQLLAQAVVAHDRLQAHYLDRGALDPAARRALLADGGEAAFYFNKVETARFFLYQLLPQNQMIAAQIASGDRSALDYLP